MPLLGGLELLLAKPLYLGLCKLGVSSKVAMSISAGASVVVTQQAIKKGAEWASREYGFEIQPAWLGYAKAAISIAVVSSDFIEMTEKVDTISHVKAFAAMIAKAGSEAFDSNITAQQGEAAIAVIIHAIGDEKKLGFA